jgi:uncharacterized protein YukJ
MDNLKFYLLSSMKAEWLTYLGLCEIEHQDRPLLLGYFYVLPKDERKQALKWAVEKISKDSKTAATYLAQEMLIEPVLERVLDHYGSRKTKAVKEAIARLQQYLALQAI